MVKIPLDACPTQHFTACSLLQSNGTCRFAINNRDTPLLVGPCDAPFTTAVYSYPALSMNRSIQVPTPRKKIQHLLEDESSSWGNGGHSHSCSMFPRLRPVFISATVKYISQGINDGCRCGRDETSDDLEDTVRGCKDNRRLIESPCKEV